MLNQWANASDTTEIAELDALIVRAQQMKRILENGLNCGWLRIEDCGGNFK